MFEELHVNGVVTVEAYPDVAGKYVQVITQWPGRAAEEVEQQVTTPVETQLNGVGHLTHLRSLSLAGLSVVTMIFDDDSDTGGARLPRGAGPPQTAIQRRLSA